MPSIAFQRRQRADSIDSQRAAVDMKTGDKLEPTSEGSSEVTEVQLNQVAKSTVA